MKKAYLGLFTWLALSAPLLHSEDYGLPTDIQAGNILHCFDWTFNDIKSELPNIANAGFGAVQVSPVQGNCATNAEWFYAYMPYDFVFKANGNGSRQQLQDLCAEAAKYGIKIVVDVVANHVNQASGYHDTWWDSSGRVRWNGGVNYSDRYSITHNQLGEYGDVNSEDSQVQARAKAFVEDLKSLGVKGIRWDAAKHIGLPSEGCDFWKTVTSVSGMWHYGEILDGPGGDKYTLLKEYSNYIGVSDTEYSKWTLGQICNGTVPTGHGSWTPNGVAGTKVVYWGESHDDYSNDGQYGTNTATISQDKIDRAWAIGACRNNETALYFSRPSATTRNAIRMGQKGSTHFKEPQIAWVNRFRNAMTGREDYFTATNGIACVTRKGGGAVIVIGAGGSRNVSVENGGGYVPAGTYKDQVSGNTFTVTTTTISGTVGSTGIAVVYNTDLQPVDPIDPIDPDEPETGDPDKIFYDNTNTQWEAVYVHYWGAEETVWPGKAMTHERGNIYSFVLPEGTEGVVFNNGNNGKQANDVKNPQTGHIYIGADKSDKTAVTDGGVYSLTPASLYILGNLASGSWDTSSGVKMSKSGDIYTANNVTFTPEPGAETSDCYFTFVTALGATWDAVNTGDRYGAPAKDTPLTIGQPSPMTAYMANVNASAAESWKIPAGQYDIKADFKNMTVTVSELTEEIDSIVVENSDDIYSTPEYYNLQGQRVVNPEHGIFIQVKGRTVSKILVP